MSINKDIQFSLVKVDSSHEIKSSAIGLAAYDTLCLICAKLDYDFSASSDKSFDLASEKLQRSYDNLNDAQSLFVYFGHHMTGRTNAAKPTDEKATSDIQFRLLRTQKALIVRNLERGETLSSFMLRLGLTEAKRREAASNK